MKTLAVKITPSYICGYQVETTKSRSKLQELASLQNFEKAYTQGVMTDSVAKKIRDKLTIWLLGIAYEKVDKNQIGLTTPEYPTFVTLTLSKQQQHDDEYIKRNLLMRYIEVLKKKYGVVHYYWRAEKKINKRIHFHLIIDRFVHYKDIRIEWNKIQAKECYHENFDFTRNDLGCNSTDIDKVNGQEQIIKYICKYVSKDEESDKIDGRIWGCSSALHRINNCVVLADSDVQRAYIRLLNSPLVNKKSEENYTVISWSYNNNLNSVSYELFKIYRKHCTDYYRDLYFNQAYNFARKELQEGLCKSGVRQQRKKVEVEQGLEQKVLPFSEFWGSGRRIEEYSAFDAQI